MGYQEKGNRLTRNELLKTGGDFTVEELREIALGEPEKDGGRPFLLLSTIEPVRLMPIKLQAAAAKEYEKSKDTKRVFDTLLSGFTIYRNSVNTGLMAPLVVNEGACEWPEPALFGWNDLDAVNFIGFAMGSKVKSDSVLITTQGGKVEKTLNLTTGETTTKELTEFAAHPDKNLKFRVKRVGDVRMINSASW